MNDEQYISPAKIKRQFDITSCSLRRWAEQGKIRCLRPNTGSVRGGRRVYNVEDIKRILGVESVRGTDKDIVCYARVSSDHQKEDLKRQIDVLKDAYPNARIISDIGSGLNWKRKGFNSLLESIHTGSIHTIVVTYKDRLCRFGFELFEWIIKKAAVKLVVINQSTDHEDISRELADDLLSITTVFVARNNGLRSGQYRRQRKVKETQETTETEEERSSTSGESY